MAPLWWQRFDSSTGLRDLSVCVGTDRRHLFLLSQLLQLVELLLWFDRTLFHIVHGLQGKEPSLKQRGRGKEGVVSTHLVKEVTDSELVVVQQDLLFCGKEPLAHGQTGSWDGWGVVLDVKFVRELVWSEFTHCRRNGRETERNTPSSIESV